MQNLVKLFKPENYRLSFDFYRDDETFSGRVIIKGQRSRSAEQIKLDAVDLVIKKVLLNQKESNFLQEDGILSIPSDEQIDCEIDIEFSGPISQQMLGVYFSNYKLGEQEKRLISTQFESHYARRAFPCVDEPNAKATFDLEISCEAGLSVLSNMPVKEQIEKRAKQTVSFETTPKMSPYTLAFVIGDLVKIEGLSRSGVQVSAYACDNHDAKELEFALKVGIEALDWYEEFFGVAYPLPKCDHVAIPDFGAGAMENWGLVTYREALLLADETTALSTKKQIASVIAHELAHMWFGNLVTMKWWDELWLNESLATLLEHYAVDAIFPEYKIWDDFYSFNFQYAQNRDALPGVQAVLTEVKHPDEISTVFDGAIVYAKGACVMLMLQKYLGLDVFRAVLEQFLNKFAYENPSGADFLRIFDRISGKNVTEFMQKWLTQSGFPLLELKDGKVSQRQFGYDSDQTWEAPLGNSIQPNMLSKAEVSAEGDLLNRDIVSFAVTNYGAKEKAKLRELLARDKLSELDKFYFLHNQILLAKHNCISSQELVDDLRGFIGQKSSLLVWNNLAKILANLRFFVEESEAEKALKNLIIKLAKPELDRLGFVAKANEAPSDTELRALVISHLSYAEDAKTIEKLLEIYENQQDNLLEIDPDLRSIVLSAKLKYDFSKADFEKLISLYQSTNNPDFKDDIRTGLTSVRNIEAGKKLIGLLGDAKTIKNQDLNAWFVMILRNRHFKQLAWRWLKVNFSALRQTFSANKDYADFARYAGAILYSDQDLLEFDELFSPYRNDLAMTRTIEVGLHEIKLRNELYRRDRQAVLDALTK